MIGWWGGLGGGDGIRREGNGVGRVFLQDEIVPPFAHGAVLDRNTYIFGPSSALPSMICMRHPVQLNR
jgi:hypothetical protein